MATLRDQLTALLGDQKREITDASSRDAAPVAGVPCADVTFRFDNGDTAPAWYIHQSKPAPAVLYCHAHGNAYEIGRDEVLQGRPALYAPYGPALAEAGFSVLCVEMPCFGARSDLKESAEAKAAQWQGKPLFGRMLAELSAAFRWLQAQPGTGPIATLGLSMGATHAFWLAALEPQIAAAAHIAAFADLETLIATGAHDLHGPYMTVPGLLPLARTGQIAGLIAPRPQLVCGGLLDPLTSPEALNRGLDDLRSSYTSDHNQLKILIDPTLGHAENAAMRSAVMEFLERALQ